jgi:subtilase family serine protease
MVTFLKFSSLLALALLLQSCTSNTHLPVSCVSAASHSSLSAAHAFTDIDATNIDDSRVVTLAGNTHPLARPQFDQGPVAAGASLSRMILALAPSAAQQSALSALLAAQHDPSSPLFHHWLTPADYGARFGVSPHSLTQLTAWLQSRGFTIDEIPPSGGLIVFSGSAAQVADAFHTELHHYRVNGADHIANAQDPQIPAAFAGLISGIVSLTDFRSSSMVASGIASRRPLVTSSPQYSAGSTHYLFPADFAAIYDVAPLYSASLTGSGVSIAVLGRSNINLSDVATFRSNSALAAHQPTVVVATADPGLVAADQDESTLDVEWAGAVAPAASVQLVLGASTQTTDGIDLAAEYAVNHAIAPVLSLSYANCESSMGSAELAFYNSLWQQAAAQGISVFVASGDSGAAACSAASSSVGSQLAVNGMCSSPFATCVGGTQFDEGSNPAAYWSTSNAAGNASALGYIPEEVWNESAANGGAGLWASGGGVSSVYAQPAWQSVVSGAALAGGRRAVPDVALAAADHDGSVAYENGSFQIISGTSVAAPSFAALMALIVQQQHGVGQGNANAGLYPLAASGQQAFHPTAAGNNSVPGVPGFTAAGATYNLATGLGSPDAALIAANWPVSTVSAAPSLTLTAIPATVTIVQGGSVAASFTAATGGSFSGIVGFTFSGLPAGVASPSPIAYTAPASGTATVTAAITLSTESLAHTGSSLVTVTAAGDGLNASGSFTLVVQPPQACSSLP